MVASSKPRRSNVPSEALRALESAARLHSFKAAANELNITPAAVSQRIKSLEDYLGTILFVRLNRSIRLTEAGQALAAALRDGFTIIDRAVGVAYGDSAPPSTVTISVLPSFAIKCLVPHLGRFYARHPSIRLRIEASDERVDLSRERRFDLAIRYGQGPYRGLSAEPLDTSRQMVPVCKPTKNSTPAPDAPLSWPLLHTDRPQHDVRLEPSDWRGWFRRAGWAEPARSFAGPAFSNAHLAIAAAIGGQGVALTPEVLVRDDLAEGHLVRASQVSIFDPFRFWVLCVKERANRNAVKAFRRWLVAEFEDNCE